MRSRDQWRSVVIVVVVTFVTMVIAVVVIVAPYSVVPHQFSRRNANVNAIYNFSRDISFLL